MTHFKTLLTLVIVTYFSTISLFSQKLDNPFEKFKNASWLKDEDVAIAKSTETFNFSIEDTEGGAKVIAKKDVDETLFPSKLNQNYQNRIYVNDEIVVEDVKLSIKGKNKLAKSTIDVHEVHDENIFYSDSKAIDYGLKFDQMLEIQHFYTSKVLDVRYLSVVFFPTHHPIVEKELVFDIPDWLDIDFKEYNFEGYKITKKITPNPKGGKRVSFTARELMAYKNEKKAPNAKRIFPHVMLLFKSFKDSKGKKHQIFETVGDLYGWYNGICKGIGNTPSVLKSHVETLTAGKKTDLEKIESIFYWVQDNIRYIAFENGIMGFRPDACQNVYKNLYGDCKGMANLLKQMLTIAGYDARLTWIGTNDIPYDYSTPCLAVDNHMICTVILNGKKYFLDGTEDYIALDDYATRIQGRQVLIEDGKNHILDRVPSFNFDRNQINQVVDLSLNKDLTLTGSIQADYAGETKTRILYTYNHIPNDKRKEALKEFIGSGNSNLSIKSVETSSTEGRKNPFKVKAAFDYSHVVSVSGKEMYLTLDLDKEFEDYKIDSTRHYDWEFMYTSKDNTVTTFNIPSDYKVDYMPDPVSINTSFFKVELKYEVKDSKIIYTKQFIIPELILKKKDFVEWNKGIKTLKTFYKDQIVLVKK